MEAVQRRNILIVVVPTILVGVGLLIWLALRDAPHASIEGLFTDDVPEEQWPPESDADLEAELAITAAARRIGAAGMISGVDAGQRPAGDIPGLQVRTNLANDLYYIEAVIGRGAHFTDPMPMAVLIHGRGDRARIPGGPFWGLGGPVRVIVPQAPDPLGDGFEWLPVRVGESLVDRLTTSLLQRAGQVAGMLRELMDTLPTVGKPLVVGFSQGGLLTFALATHHSDVVQAAFPLAAWLPPAMVPPYRRGDLRYPRIRGMHGAIDTIIEPAPTEALYETLEERGFEVELELFPDVAHEMTDAMNQRLHEWLAEEMGYVIEQGIADGLLDGGEAPCLPPGQWPAELSPEAGPPEAGWPDALRPEAGWPEGGWAQALRPEAGWPQGAPGSWTPCVQDAGVPEAGTPPTDAGAPAP